MGTVPDLWLGLQSPPLAVAGRAAEPMQPNEIKSPSHLIVLKAISLAFGAVSLLSASVTLYWFVRMRGNFRHNLIILLILGDFMKSLWFVIFPIRSFASGNEDPSYAFCQASGYGLSLGIEAADCAVFLIAIHFAMSIFRRQHSRSSGGLEPYRFYVYAFWVGFPVLMASLIFVDCNRGYGNFGQYCYVPNRPTWCRLVLSWVPRYLVFVTIVSLAVCIFIYVSVVLKRYSLGDPGASTSIPRHRKTNENDVSPLPWCLLSPMPSPSNDIASSTTAGAYQAPVISDCQLRHDINSQGGRFPEHNNSLQQPASRGSNLAGSLPSEEHLDRLGDSATRTVNTLDQGPADTHITATSQPGPMQEPPPTHTGVRNCEPQSDPQTKARPLSCQSVSQFLWEGYRGMVKGLSRLRPSTTSTHIQNKLCHDPSQPNSKGEGEVISASMSSSAYVSSGSGPEMNTSIEQAHQRIRRQLRLLFVYPLVYLTIWVCPFILHLVRLRTDIKDPFPLLVLTMMSLCAAGSVDSAIFMARERPWRFARAGFWKSLCRRLHIGWGTSAKFQGLSREEMLANAIMAHDRRQEEVALERVERRATAERSARGRRKVAENWWDLTDGVDKEEPGERDELSVGRTDS